MFQKLSKLLQKKNMIKSAGKQARGEKQGFYDWLKN